MILSALVLALQAGAVPDSVPGDGVVRGVIFHSPSCPHCRTVLARDLPPLEARWGPRLEILRVDVSRPEGATLYRAAVRALALPESRRGVPMLLMGGEVMLGSGEIPARLPGLVESAAGAGLDWPSIPGLMDHLAAGVESAEELPPVGMPEGGGLAWGVLALLALSLGGGVVRRMEAAGRDGAHHFRPPAPGVTASAAALILLGLGVSGYLASNALGGAETVCGPVGDCTAVHGSRYAQIMGVPVAVLGVVFFAGTAVLWGAFSRVRAAGGLLLASGLAGVVFSIYLTVLELFVIRAVCLWCLVSATVVAGLFWLAAGAVPHRRP